MLAPLCRGGKVLWCRRRRRRTEVEHVKGTLAQQVGTADSSRERSFHFGAEVSTDHLGSGATDFEEDGRSGAGAWCHCWNASRTGHVIKSLIDACEEQDDRWMLY